MRLSRRAALILAAALPAAGMRLAPAHAAAAPLSLGGARTGTGQARWAEALAVAVTAAGGPDLTVETTGGSAPNLALLQTRRIGFGLVTLDRADEAWRGASELGPGVPFDLLRAVVPVEVAIAQTASTAAVGITAIAGLRGKTIAIARGDTLMPALYAAIGLKHRTRTAAPEDAPILFAEEKISGVGALRPHRLGPDLVVFGFAVNEIATLIARFPGLSAVDIPPPHGAAAEAPPPPDDGRESGPGPAALAAEDEIATLIARFPGTGTVAITSPSAVAAAPRAEAVVPLATRSVGLWTWLFASSEMPVDVVEAVARAAIVRRADLAATAGFDTTNLPDPQGNTLVPYHAGAAAAYAAAGIRIPPARVR
jgi:hypothetical protein